MTYALLFLGEVRLRLDPGETRICMGGSSASRAATTQDILATNERCLERLEEISEY